MAQTNFSQWNPGAANQETDAAYQADSQRLSGAVNGEFWNDVLANKILYQVSTAVRSLMVALVGKGYTTSDGTTPFSADTSSSAGVAALSTVLSNILTQADNVPQGVSALNFPNNSGPVTGAGLATPPSGGALYRISWYAKVTTPASGSSTLGVFTVSWTDIDGVAQSEIVKDSAGLTTNSGNTTTTLLSGTYVIAAGPGSVVGGTFGYTSSGGTAMHYELYIRTELVSAL
jgi:hypothetical protein